MMERVCAIIASAGKGSRMGTGTKKQYLLLRGRHILAHTISVFESCPSVHDIVLVVPEGEVGLCEDEIVKPSGFSKVRKIVEGGRERQDSVRKGLSAAQGCDIVMIHDGVRPFVTEELIKDVLAAASRWGAAIPGIPVRDTVKTVDGEGLVVRTLDREALRLIQTPQAFRKELIMEAHRKALEEGVLSTDDSALVERLGRPVAVVEGSWKNIKITTRDDLELAELIMEMEGP